MSLYKLAAYSLEKESSIAGAMSQKIGDVHHILVPNTLTNVERKGMEAFNGELKNHNGPDLSHVFKKALERHGIVLPKDGTKIRAIEVPAAGLKQKNLYKLQSGKLLSKEEKALHEKIYDDHIKEHQNTDHMFQAADKIDQSGQLGKQIKQSTNHIAYVDGFSNHYRRFGSSFF